MVGGVDFPNGRGLVVKKSSRIPCLLVCLLFQGDMFNQEPENPKLYFIIEGHLHVMKNGYLVAALSSKSITGILDVYGILRAIHKLYQI